MTNWTYTKTIELDRENIPVDTYRFFHESDLSCSEVNSHNISLDILGDIKNSYGSPDLLIDGEINQHPHVFGFEKRQGFDSNLQKRWLTSNFKVSKSHTLSGYETDKLCSDNIIIPFQIIDSNNGNILRKFVLIFNMNCLVHFQLNIEIDGNDIFNQNAINESKEGVLK